MNHPNAVDVKAWIDARPISRFQWNVLLLCFVIIMLDGYDAAVMGFIAPALLEDWGISRAELGPILGAAMFGVAIGALVAGPLSDRYGRKQILLWSVAFFAIFSLAAAMAQSPSQLALMRFLTGLGLGAVMPNCVTLVAEYMPERRKGLMIIQTKRQAAGYFKPGAYVDVAVMAPVPPAGLNTPLLTGGPQAQAVTSLLTSLGFNARYGAERVGSVSAIKMCRSVMIKGLEALTTECLFAAREYGVEEEVLASLHASFPSLGWNATFPGYLISRVAEHGIRRSEEMEEVVKTLRDAGGEGLMSQATAAAQRQLPERMAACGVTYAQLEPFDWQMLAQKVRK